MEYLVVHLSTKESITIELYPTAPNAIRGVKRIIGLAKYNGKRIERLEPNFVLQPLFFDGVDNDIDMLIEKEITPSDSFLKYTVGMAATEEQSSATQFFITLRDAPHLNQRFTILGKVVEGMDVCERLNQLEVLEGTTCGFSYHYPKEDIIVECIEIKMVNE